MSDWATVLVALCTSIPPTITALASYRQARKTDKKVDEVHAATNGMKAELVAATKLAAFAAGRAEGQLDPK